MEAAAGHAGRKYYLDVAKAVGIIAIVTYHSLPPPALRFALLSFALPLFFFVSGAVYKDRDTDHPVAYSWRRFKRLWIPYAGWGLFYLALHNVFIKVNILSDRFIWEGEPLAHFMSGGEMAYRGVRVLAFYWVEHMGGPLWFLPLLFMTSVFFVAVSWACSRLSPNHSELLRLVALAALILAGYLQQQLITFPEGLNVALVALLFFYEGYAYRRVEAKIPWRWYLGAAATVVVALWGSWVSIGDRRFSSPFVLVLVPLCGIYACLLLGHLLEERRFFRYLGRHTIFVLATHILAFKLVSWAIVSIQGLPTYRLADFPAIEGGAWWILYAAVGVLVPLGTMRFLIEPAAAAVRPVFARGRALIQPTSSAGG